MATTGHESEAINVQGLKASLQKLKTNHIDGKAGKSTTLAGYGITDAYTKSETYTKTEVNGLVDTPHQEYVTVEATSQTTATTDVLPNSGQAADTIYRVSNWDGSANSGAGAFDVTCYSEYAWDDVSNPNKYVFLCVKTQIGEVFDISVYNNNAKYANLAAALGTDGEHVPQSLRKGGMSIKFVQSSDNNSTQYVQYRYMSASTDAADFTNIANWQGVDDKPTANSKNLVTSGGVEVNKADVIDLLNAVCLPIYLEQGSTSNSTGELVDLSNAVRTSCIFINTRKLFIQLKDELAPIGYTVVTKISYYNSSQQYIGYITWTNSRVIVLPNEAVYARLVFGCIDSGGVSINSFTVEDANKLSIKCNISVVNINSLIDKEYWNVLGSYNTYEQGTFENSTGRLVYVQDAIRTKRIKLKSNTIQYFIANPNMDYPIAKFKALIFDANGDRIAAYDWTFSSIIHIKESSAAYAMMAFVLYDKLGNLKTTFSPEDAYGIGLYLPVAEKNITERIDDIVNDVVKTERNQYYINNRVNDELDTYINNLYLKGYRNSDGIVIPSTTSVINEYYYIVQGSTLSISIVNTDELGDNILRTKVMCYNAEREYLGYIAFAPNRIIELLTNTSYVRLSFALHNGSDYIELSSAEDINKLGIQANVLYYPKLQNNIERIRSAGGFRIANWNIGHYSYGNLPNSAVTSSNYNENRKRYLDILSKCDADIICINEYSDVFCADYQGEEKDAREVLFGEYPIFSKTSQISYSCNAIASYRYPKEKNIVTIIQGRPFVEYRFKINEKEVIIAAVHIGFAANDNDAEALSEIETILNYYSNDDYVIVIGDNNIVKSEHYAIYTDAGYTIANGGVFGDFITWDKYKTSSEGSEDMFDNICSKGFQMSNVHIVADFISDHCPFICDLIMNE